MKIAKMIVVFAVALTAAIVFFNNKFKCISTNFHIFVDGKEGTFSVMSFNTAAFDSVLFTVQFQDELLRIIAQEKPDIVCFQELSCENLAKIIHQVDHIYGNSDALNGDDSMVRWRFYSHLPYRNIQRLKCSGDLFSEDMTDDEVSYIIQAQKYMNVMSSEFEVEPGHWVTLYSGQLRSSAYSTARRSVKNKNRWIDGLPLYIRNYKVGKRIRDYEAENVRRLMDVARANGKPVIVAGDLNDWCGSDCLNTLMGDDLMDAWWEGGNGFGWTYFGWHLRLRLDHILYSDELELVDVKVIDSDLSDHKPLMARFRVK